MTSVKYQEVVSQTIILMNCGRLGLKPQYSKASISTQSKTLENIKRQTIVLINRISGKIRSTGALAIYLCGKIKNLS